MRVLVTGATGFLGGGIARALVEAGHTVRALVRASSKLDNLEGLSIELTLGDLLDPDAVAGALRGMDAVVHAAGVVGFERRRASEILRVNLQATETVLDGARAAGVRAVMTSSVAALGGRDSPEILDEDSGSNARQLGIAYFTAKLDAEQAAMRRIEDGLDGCILRPAVVLGPGDVYRSSAAGFVLPLARGAMPAYVEGGASFTDVRDVARAHVAALERAPRGRTYMLGGENLTTSALADRVARCSGVRAPRRVPFGVAKAIAHAAEKADEVLGTHVDMPVDLVRAARLYTFVSSRRAEAELHYRPRSIDETLRDTLAYFLAHKRLEATTPELSALSLGGGA